MTRAYLRLDPAFWERKRIEQAYPPGAISALIGIFCLAESQPERGRFRSEKLLRALLEDDAKWVPFLKEHGDLVVLGDARIYPPGWDEWQEGDWKVGERVQRIRGREHTVRPVPAVTTKTVRKRTPATVSDVTVPTVYTPSDGGRPAMPRSTPPGNLKERGGGGGAALAGRDSARPNGLSRISVDDLPSGLADLDELPPAPTTTDSGTRR